MVQENLKIVKIVKLKDTVRRYSFLAPQISQAAAAGQFININVSPTPALPLLRRPISIFNIEREKETIDIIFQLRGQGTNILANKAIGDEVDVIGPLGRGFRVGDFKNIAIVGGGIGIFPLHQLAKEYFGKANITTYLGFKNKSQVLLIDAFAALSNQLIVATDDGSYGEKGYAVHYFQKDIAMNAFDAVFACGPSLMLSAVQAAVKVERKTLSTLDFASADSGDGNKVERKALSTIDFASADGGDGYKNENIYCEVSLEERMGCAIGACMGCSVRLQNNADGNHYARVCKDGPVFAANEVVIGDGQ